MLDVVPIHQKEYEIEDKNERIVIAQAPGRLLLLGGHNQLGQGVYLGAALDHTVKLAVSARKDNSIRVFTSQTSERKRFSILSIRYKREDRWANHVKLAICIFADMGHELKGMNFTIGGEVPQNVGLGSASAVELSSALALKRFLGSNISEDELIKKLIEYHKTFYPGEDVTGDFLLMMNAKKDHFVLLDESTFAVERIKNPFSKHAILIVNSKVPFVGTEDELRIRREALDTGLEKLCKKRKARSFKDFIHVDTLELMNELDDEVRRRSIHVIRELSRIKEMEAALLEGNASAVSHGLVHSHESLRDLYEVSCPEADWLVKRALETEGVLGARLCGTGFGRCVFVLILPEKIEEYLSKMEEYERIFGFHALYYQLHFGEGAKLVRTPEKKGNG